jgi:hypothetical protein
MTGLLVLSAPRLAATASTPHNTGPLGSAAAEKIAAEKKETHQLHCQYNILPLFLPACNRSQKNQHQQQLLRHSATSEPSIPKRTARCQHCPKATAPHTTGKPAPLQDAPPPPACSSLHTALWPSFQ